MLKRVGFFLFFILASVHRTSADSSFFEDKTIRLVLGFSPGGISDLWARALARALTPHIPGKPNIISQNMPGAGSLTAANYIYSVAKPDGLTIGLYAAGPLLQSAHGHEGSEVRLGKVQLDRLTGTDGANYLRPQPTRHIKTSRIFVTRRSSRAAAPLLSARWGIISPG